MSQVSCVAVTIYHRIPIGPNACVLSCGAVTIPDYKLDGETVQDAIQALALGIEKATDGKIAPNFIIEDPKGKLADIRISLQLKNVPVKAILDYIHAQASTRARYDEHAVVIMPR